MQTTLASSAQFEGLGLHSGKPVRLTVTPAPADHGITFARADLPGSAPLPATWDKVIVSPLNTQLEGPDGATVSTIEHLMAALAGLGIHNARCILTGPEVPILDGSSAPFVAGLSRAGRRTLSASLRALEVIAPIEVRHGLARARLSPREGFTMDFTIDFPDAAIGHQALSLDLSNGTFLRELADCRTFCRAADVEDMHANGLALGGTLDNAVVVSGAQVLTPGGLRRPDEPVRHKMLDALGDLATLGVPLLAHYEGHRAGHGLTNALLRALMAQPEAWRWRRLTPDLMAHLPGYVVQPADLAAVA